MPPVCDQSLSCHRSSFLRNGRGGLHDYLRLLRDRWLKCRWYAARGRSDEGCRTLPTTTKPLLPRWRSALKIGCRACRAAKPGKLTRQGCLRTFFGNPQEQIFEYVGFLDVDRDERAKGHILGNRTSKHDRHAKICLNRFLYGCCTAEQALNRSFSTSFPKRLSRRRPVPVPGSPPIIGYSNSSFLLIQPRWARGWFGATITTSFSRRQRCHSTEA